MHMQTAGPMVHVTRQKLPTTRAGDNLLCVLLATLVAACDAFAAFAAFFF